MVVRLVVGTSPPYSVPLQGALHPPDIQIYKDVLEFFAQGTKGRLEDKPTMAMIESFSANFEAGMASRRRCKFSKEVSTTPKEVSAIVFTSDFTRLFYHQQMTGLCR